MRIAVTSPGAVPVFKAVARRGGVEVMGARRLSSYEQLIIRMYEAERA